MLYTKNIKIHNIKRKMKKCLSFSDITDILSIIQAGLKTSITAS